MCVWRLERLKSWCRTRVSDFIQTDSGEDVFFHHSTVANMGFDGLTEGQQVEYTVDQGTPAKGKGPRAASVTPS